MTKLLCTISAACVTQDYFSEHGSVVIACPGVPIISESIPKNQTEVETLLIKINQLIMSNNIYEVKMILELDEYSNDSMQLFPIHDYIEKLESPARWNIDSKYFFDGQENSIAHFYYDPMENY